MTSPDEVIKKAEQRKEKVYDHIRDAAEFFHEYEGELLERNEAKQSLVNELSVEPDIAGELITQLTGDLVDPVIQVNTPGKSHVGVIDYTEGEGWYGYVEYDDIKGESRTVVCAQCVHESDQDNEVTYAREGVGSFADGEYNYDELSSVVKDHYSEHDVTPGEVETGATLLSGTTIGGQTAWHDGTSSISPPTVRVLDELEVPSYQTLSDVPSTLAKGSMVYIADKNKYYYEDGT